MKNVAFLLKGSVSKTDGKILSQNSLYRPSKYVNFYSTFDSIKQHILDKNPDYKFDFFLHGWNEDISKDLVSLYKPVKYSFENNNLYADYINKKLLECRSSPGNYSQVSQAISVNKGCKLIEDFSLEKDIVYDYIIIYRYDVILWKDMIIKNYDHSNIYVNNFQDGLGDFHFIMNFDNMKIFKDSINYLSINNPPHPHFHFKYYINNIMKKDIFMDDIVAGRDQEVTRKIKNVINNNPNLLTQLINFGLSKEEIYSYMD